MITNLAGTAVWNSLGSHVGTEFLGQLLILCQPLFSLFSLFRLPFPQIWSSVFPSQITLIHTLWVWVIRPLWDPPPKPKDAGAATAIKEAPGAPLGILGAIARDPFVLLSSHGFPLPFTVRIRCKEGLSICRAHCPYRSQPRTGATVLLRGLQSDPAEPRGSSRCWLRHRLSCL